MFTLAAEGRTNRKGMPNALKLAAHPVILSTKEK
jgi:hypothetical protein